MIYGAKMTLDIEGYTLRDIGAYFARQHFQPPIRMPGNFYAAIFICRSPAVAPGLPRRLRAIARGAPPAHVSKMSQLLAVDELGGSPPRHALAHDITK